MNRHFSAAARAARLGAFVGLLGLLSVLIDFVTGAPINRTFLLLVVLIPVASAVGGALYSVLLSAFAGSGMPASSGARFCAGMAAGALAAGLAVLPFLWAHGRDAAIFLIGVGAMAGAMGGVMNDPASPGTRPGGRN